MPSRINFYLMVFCTALIVSSCSTSDEAETESSPVPITSEAAQVGKNPDAESALISPEESISEKDSIEQESELMNTSNGRVVRTSPDNLQITLESGEKVILKDENIYGDHPNKYIYIGFDENLESYLVELQSHENFSVLAIDAINGYQTRLAGLPIYNTQQNMFVCYGGRGSAPGPVIELYSVYGSGMGNVFRRKLEWTIENASWEDETTVKLTVPLILPGGDIVKGEAKIEPWGQGPSRSWYITRPQYYKGKWKAEDKSDSESDPVSISSEDDFYKPGYKYDLIKASDGRVMKLSQDILQINLENGEKIILHDNDGSMNHANIKLHTYKGFDEISGYHLIELTLHEDFGVLAVNAKDGSMQDLPGLPVYNPSKDTFVCYGGGGPILSTILEIYSVQDLKMKNVLSEAPDWYGIQNASWEDDTTIVLNVEIFTGTDNSNMEMTINDKAKIQFIDGEWQIIHPDLFEKMQREKEGQN